MKILCEEYSSLGFGFGRIWQRQLPTAPDAACSRLWGFAAAQGLQTLTEFCSTWFHLMANGNISLPNSFCLLLLPPSPAPGVVPLCIERHEHNLVLNPPHKVEGFIQVYLSDPNFMFFPVKSFIMAICQYIFSANKKICFKYSEFKQ